MMATGASFVSSWRVPSLAALLLNEVLAPQDFAGLALIALGLAAIDGRLLRVLGRRPPQAA